MTSLVPQALRFAVVGLLNTAVGLGVIYAAMYLFGWGPVTANAIGYAVGLAIGFSLNRSWTFESKHAAGHSLAKYLLVVVIAYFANLSVVLMSVLMARNLYVSQLLGVVVYTSVVFLGSRWFVFAQTAACSDTLPGPSVACEPPQIQ